MKAIKFVSFEDASKMGEVTLVTSGKFINIYDSYLWISNKQMAWIHKADVHGEKYANAQTVVQHGLCQE